jgi:ligand-binding sensor domain-containing protein/signal transduction histidine kinase
MSGINSIIKGFFIAFALIICTFFSYGKEKMVFEHLTTKYGLSSGTVNSILLDSKGFMWFCIDDGLNRYDGYSFKLFKAGSSEQSIDKYIQFNEINEDGFGTIWASTSDGLFFFDREKEELVHFLSYTGFSLPNNLLNDIITSVFADSHGYLWVGTYNGLVRIRLSANISAIQHGHITVYYDTSSAEKKLHNNLIQSICEDQNRNIWIANPLNVLQCYNYETDQFSDYLIDIPIIKRWQSISKKIVADKDNNIWISTQGLGVFFWDRAKNSFEHFQSFEVDGNEVGISLVRCIMIDSQNRAWIGSDGNGLVVYDRKNNLVSNYYKDINDHSNLSSNAIYSLYEDKNRNYWVGTYLTGVNKVIRNKLIFGVHFSIPNSTNKLSHNVVTNFCEDHNGKIWISTDGGGVNIYDRKTGLFKHFKHDPNNKNSLSINTAITLYCDNDNRIWIGTYNGGLNIYDQQLQQFKHYMFKPSDPNSISSNHVWGFVQDKWGNMWVATVNSGLNLMKKGTDSFVRYEIAETDYRGPDQISCNAITYLFIDNKNRLWIGTEWGLNMVELDGVDFSQAVPKLRYNHYINSDHDSTINENRISHINQDKRGDIWVGTRGSGMIKLNLEDSIHTFYTVKDGLAHNIVRGILFDDDDNLWISTNNGISNFNVASGQFKNYDASYGLQSDFFMKTACLRASDGTMFFGGTNGFNEFKPNDIVSETSLYSPVITDFKIFNQSVPVGANYNGRVPLNKSIIETDEIELSYHDNEISFEFSALDYASPEKNLFLYKLEGSDKDWQMTDAKMRMARYTNLDPGEYTFMVKASSNDENWPDNQTTVRVIIYPPWWKTRFFQISSILLIVIILILVYYVRVYSLQKQKLLLRKTVDEKTKQLQIMNQNLREAIQTKDKFMSIIAHDLINPFNTILGFSDLLITNFEGMDDGKKLKTLKTINQSSNDLYELLGNLLQWSRSERGLMKFSPEKIEIKGMITKMLSVMSLLANTKHIIIKTEYPENKVYVFADVQLLNTIIRNLISNSIKFSHKESEVIINVIEKDAFALISIIDKGVGISLDNLEKMFKIESHTTSKGTNDEKGTGLGLLLVNEFVEKQGGKLRVKSILGQGSTFSFTVPLWKE